MHSKEGVELEAVMEAYSKSTHQFELQNGYAYKSEVVGVLKGLGFDESDLKKDEYSFGRAEDKGCAWTITAVKAGHNYA